MKNYPFFDAFQFKPQNHSLIYPRRKLTKESVEPCVLSRAFDEFGMSSSEMSSATTGSNDRLGALLRATILGENFPSAVDMTEARGRLAEAL